MIKKISEKKRTKKILIWGPPKSGKTELSCSFPEPIVLDTENGTDFLHGKKDFFVSSIKSIEDMNVALISVEKQKLTGTLIVDSMTDIWYMLVLDWTRKLTKEKNERGQSYKLNPTDFGFIKRDFREIIMKILGMEMDVVFTAKKRDIVEKLGNTIKKTGEIFDCDDMILHAVDIEIRCENKNGNYVCIPLASRYGRFDVFLSSYENISKIFPKSACENFPYKIQVQNGESYEDTVLSWSKVGESLNSKVRTKDGSVMTLRDYIEKISKMDCIQKDIKENIEKILKK